MVTKAARRRLTHFDAKGAVRMVQVSAKPMTRREAVVKGTVKVAPATLALILEGRIGKGDVLGAARLAGIMAAKRTPELIPLCHPTALSSIEIDLKCDRSKSVIEVAATCRAIDRTGVEMEAMTAACIAALTIYDMCKAVDRGIRITDLRLTKKSGGKSGTYRAD